jgi:signal transduction histidine kinase
MNLVPSHALLADPEGERRARVRRELLRELPGIQVAEAADSDTVIRSLERQPFDLAIVRHPLPPDPALPLVLKRRWPEHVLLLYAPVESEHALAEALETAGDGYFLDSGTALPGLRAALRLAWGRMGAALRRAEDQRDRLLESERRARAEAEAALEQLRESHEHLESLSRRLVEMQEAERRALARELHDEVGQILASLRLRLEGGTDQAAAEVQTILGELLDRVRGLSMDLRPPTLDELGLLPTLVWHFERYQAETGVRVEFHGLGAERRFAAAVETAAFRIVQEALTNVARHARVAEVEVSLDATAEGLELRVEDHGAGFEAAAASSGSSGGLAGMQERARLLGGRVRIESAPGRGTRLVAALPGSPPEGRTT